MGSRRSLRWAMVQAGEMRRSEDALADVISSGMSCAVVILMKRQQFQEDSRAGRRAWKVEWGDREVI